MQKLKLFKVDFILDSWLVVAQNVVEAVSDACRNCRRNSGNGRAYNANDVHAVTEVARVDAIVETVITHKEGPYR